MQKILDDCGIQAERTIAVHGGDINEAWQVQRGEERFFLKINNTARYPGMFEAEAAGLEALRSNSHLNIPGVIKTGKAANKQYLLLEWIEKGKPADNFWENFGRELAGMHQKVQPYFGWVSDNYIGRLKQRNKQADTWDEFYTEHRIMPLVELLFNKGLFNRNDLNAAGHYCNQLDSLFPVEHPSLLHGDLWSGNYTITPAGQACIFDPAVYFGHREMDLGMTRLFGGFDDRFYAAYHEAYPLEQGWEKRLKLTEAYPLLVHAVLFGGFYVGRAKEILGYFNDWT